jgi:hypothetical protein
LSLERVSAFGVLRWDTRLAARMQLRLSDPSYTDRLASFLESLGQTVLLVAPGVLDVDLPPGASARNELSIYLRVWKVLYPDASVQTENDEGEAPAA